MAQVDLAGIGHWDDIYQAVEPSGSAGWYPEDYGSLALEHALLSEIGRWKPASLFEVGCGNSVWLPYLARKTGAAVAGMDYSEAGCELVRRRLADEGVAGNIFCADLFEASAEQVGRYDFVYSLGMVEHFTDTAGVLAKLLEFVKPGGVLFTEVPNLISVHGLMSWVWQPELLAKHELIGRRRLVRAYRSLGLEEVGARYLGLFSLNVVAWDVHARWPRLVPLVSRRVQWLNTRLDWRLRRLGRFGGIAPAAPYLYAVGRKPRGAA